jgi:hypothetical protein
MFAARGWDRALWGDRPRALWMDLDTFTRAYCEAALWASDDDNEDSLDANYGIDSIAEETLAQMMADCEAFQKEWAEVIADDITRAGYDFWFTRNHHGVGFWDGDWEKETGRVLTDAAHAYGDFHLYVGDDGLIYGERG